MRDLVKNFPNLTYKTYHTRMLLYGCEYRPRGIERVGMSFQNLIGTNHINWDVQKWFFEEITKNTKDKTQRKKKL